MKRFLLFSGDDFYPNGGWDDFSGDFDTVEAARTAAPETDDIYEPKWWHIVDLTTMQKVDPP
jgi:hypothetical protein